MGESAIDRSALPSLGIDIGGTSTRAVAFAPDGTVLATWKRATVQGAERVVADLCDDIGKACAEVGPVASVGIGVPGMIDRDGGVSVALNLGVHDALALRQRVQETIAVPVAVENDVNAAAVGAFNRMGFAAHQSLAFVSIGTGIAAGLIHEGRLVRGDGGAAGEIGHMAAPGVTADCVCGRVGCIESVASGRALARRSDADGTPRRFRELVDLAQSGDAAASEVLGEFYDAVATACDVLTATFDPAAIVIGGGIGVSLGPVGRDEITKRLQRDTSLDRRRAASDRLCIAPADIEFGAVGANQLGRVHAGLS